MRRYNFPKIKGEQNMKYGIQMYSVRDSAKDNILSAMEGVKRIGYDSVEFAGFFDHTSGEIRDMLDKTGLECSGTHSSWKGLLPDVIEETVRYHREIGNTSYIIPSAELKTPEQLDSFVELVNFAQPLLKKEGIDLAFHNHSIEFRLMPWGATIHSQLELRTKINFELDTYWLWNAGADPIATMKRLAYRMPVIHLKDGLADGTGKSLGEGEAPVNDVLRTAREMGVRIVVESEGLQPDGMSEVARCMDFLKKNV